MKKKYLPPTLDFLVFEKNDVITASDPNEVGTAWFDNWTSGLSNF